MKVRDRVRIVHELEPQDGFTFIGMTGTVVKSFQEGVIIDIDNTFWNGTDLDSLYFEYAELEKI